MTTEEAEFRNLAVRKGLPRFRFLRRSLTIEALERIMLGTRLEPDWLSLKSKMQPGDKIWPFDFDVHAYLGLRRGYLVLRNGRPLGGIVVEVS